MQNIDKYRGCLIGGAVGDALGYPLEFMQDIEIFDKYGPKGINEYELSDEKALISDDTQMTLFTANGLLLGTTRGLIRGIMADYPSYISHCYEEWLQTQFCSYPLNIEHPYTWLINVPELFSSREPGFTCLSSIRCFSDGDIGKIETPLNISKGCGGVMRIAPIGLYFKCNRITLDKIDLIAAQTVALTHGHELGYIPAATFAHIIQLISHSDIVLIDAINDALVATERLFKDKECINEYLDLMRKAITLSQSNINDLSAIKQLGEGWVAEETLAIAIYCSLKHSDNFEKAIVSSVNHSGDSDSTGSVTGNIIGAYLGIKAIPHKFQKNLELFDVIIEIADDLYNDCKITEYGNYKDEIWEQKYIYKTYKPKKR